MISIYDESIREELMNKILNAIKPRLKAPTTAILCDFSELHIVPRTTGSGYKVFGSVSSQNSFGAMLTSKFYVIVSEYERDGSLLVSLMEIGDSVDLSESMAMRDYINSCSPSSSSAGNSSSYSPAPPSMGSIIAGIILLSILAILILKIIEMLN